jgi:hypothetical protein
VVLWAAVNASEGNYPYAEAPEQGVWMNEIQAPSTLKFGIREKKGGASRSGYLSP